MKNVSSNAAIPQDSLLCSFFEKAKENTYHTAIEDTVSQLTYDELQEQIFSVAGHLHRQEVENKTLCILGGKESGTVAAAMGAWLYGWSFFIIDEHFPMEKINKLYDLIKPSCTLIANAVGEYPDNIISEILKRDHVFFVKDLINIRLDKEVKSTIIEYASCGRGEDIALYTLTSGTTGTPKAVAISHRAWTYAVKKQVKIFKYKTHERVAIQSRFACDGIFDALCAFSVTGTAVLIVSDLFYDTKAWVNTIEQKKISCLPIISSIVHLIATDKEDASMPSCVEKIIFAGDFIHPTVVQF